MLQIIKQHKLSAFLILAANLIPLIGFLAGFWNAVDMSFFYWSELALVVAIALLPYAKHFIVFFLMLIMVTLITKVADPTKTGSPKVFFTFWGLYCTSWLLYIEMVNSRYWQTVRRKTPSEQFTAYAIFAGISLFICLLLTLAINNAWGMLLHISTRYYMFFLATALAVPTISIGMLKIIDMIGPRHFIHFLIGTYYSPVKRDKIVFFLDMVGSTGMAESMPPEKSMKLIAMFIYDAGSIIRRYRGDILNYTGDGLVVLWPRRQANMALSAAYELHHFVRSKAREYQTEFGYVPRFRVGMHAGDVTISQIGEEKLFIGLYGDTVNTAARIEQLNKKLGTTILLSRSVTKYMDNKWLIRLKKVGEQEIRGRTKPVEVFTLKNLKEITTPIIKRSDISGPKAPGSKTPPPPPPSSDETESK